MLVWTPGSQQSLVSQASGELLKLRGAFAVVTTKDYSTWLGTNGGLHQVLETETEALPTRCCEGLVACFAKVRSEA